uniref:Uncharacterized protein n=1 Tax=Plectus sambesii TaxID=2011161 RepID=A0A914WXV3_9BILA
MLYLPVGLLLAIASSAFSAPVGDFKKEGNLIDEAIGNIVKLFDGDLNNTAYFQSKGEGAEKEFDGDDSETEADEKYDDDENEEEDDENEEEDDEKGDDIDIDHDRSGDTDKEDNDNSSEGYDAKEKSVM